MAGLWAMLLSLSLMRFATVGVRMGMVPFFPELAAQYGVGYGEIGMLFSAYVLGFSLALIPSGILADRIHPARLMVPAVFLIGIAGVGTFLTASLWVAIVTRFIVGVGAAFAFVPAAKLINTTLAPGQRSRGISTMEMGATTGALFSMTAAPMLAGIIPFGWLLLVPPLGCLIAGVILFRVVKAPKAAPAKPRPWRTSLQGLPARDLWLCIGLVVLGIGAVDTAFAWLATYLRDVAGMDRSQSGLTMMVMMATQVAAFYPVGVLADRFGRLPLINAGGILLAVGLLLVWLLPAGLPLVVGAALIGLGVPGSFSLPLVLLAERFGPERSGILTSLAITLAQVTVMGLSVAGGWVIDLTGSFHPLWLAVILLLVVRVLIGFVLHLRPVPGSAEGIGSAV